MVREVILDMSNINFKGNTLDVGINNYGIIYNILKQTESEISVDLLKILMENIEINMIMVCFSFL